MLQKYTSIAICYLLATTSSGVVVSANNNNNNDDRTAELYNNNVVNNNVNGRGDDEGGNNERRSFLNLGRRHFNHRTLLSNNNKQRRQQDASDRSLQVDEEATQLSEAQTAKEEAEQIMLSSSPEAQSAISQTINDIQTNPDLSPLEKETMLKLLKSEATEIQSQVIDDELHMNTSKKKKMEKLNEEITNVEVIEDELDVAIQLVEEEVIKETLLKGTEEQKFNTNNLSPTSGDKKYPTKAPSTIGIAGGGGGGAYMKIEEPTTYEPTYSPSPSSSSLGSSALTTGKSGGKGKSGKSGGKSGKSGGTKSHKMDPSSYPTRDSLQPTADDDYYTPSPSGDDTPSPSDDTPSPTVTDSPTPAALNTPRPSDDSTKEPSHLPTGTPSSSPTKEPSVSPSSSPTSRPTVPDGSTLYDGFEEGETDFPKMPWSVSSSLGMSGIGHVPEIIGGGFDRRRLQDVPLERAEDNDEFERELNHWTTYHPSYEGTPSPTTYTYSPDSTYHPTWREEPTNEPSNESTPKPVRPPPTTASPVSMSPTTKPTRRPPTTASPITMSPTTSNPSKAPSTSPTSTPSSEPTSSPTPKEVNWAITNEKAYTGKQSIKSPKLSCGAGTANVTLSLDDNDVPYPGNLSFWYYCDNSPSEGGLHWYVDGEMKGSSDDMMTGWMMEDLMIESPGHVTWSYVYDCNGDSEMDIMDEAGTAYIDVVTFKPHLSPTGFPSSSPSHSPTHEPTSNPSHDSLAPSGDPLPDCPAKFDNCLPGGCEGVCKGAQGKIDSGSCLGRLDLDTPDIDMTCVDLDGFVGTDSCLGVESCKNLIGSVADDSCLLDHACKDSSNVDIKNGSCKGKEACKNLSGTVRSNSCISDHACQNSDTAVIGTRSCLGEKACKDNTADINDYSCQGGEACTMNKAKIGARSCQAKAKACFHNEGSIGNGSCTNTIDTEDDDAVSMCENNKGTIGSGSCNGYMACYNNMMTIRDNSCNGFMACYNNTNIPNPELTRIPSSHCNGRECLSDNPSSSCSPCEPA